MQNEGDFPFERHYSHIKKRKDVGRSRGGGVVLWAHLFLAKSKKSERKAEQIHQALVVNQLLMREK